MQQKAEDTKQEEPSGESFMILKFGLNKGYKMKISEKVKPCVD